MVSTTVTWIIVATVAVAAAVAVTLALVLGRADNTATPTPTPTPTAPAPTHPRPTTPGPHPPVPPGPAGKGGVVGAWGVAYNAADQQKYAATPGIDFIALASLLPQYWGQGDEKLFSTMTDVNLLQQGLFKTHRPPMGWWVSFGGSNAQQWELVFGTPGQPDDAHLGDVADTLIRWGESFGINGFDFDAEGNELVNEAFTPNVIRLVHLLRSKLVAKNGEVVVKWEQDGETVTHPYYVSYTILLGGVSMWNDLVASATFDYLVTMNYNGGLYQADGTGAGCDYDGWIETFYSKCKDIPCNPLRLNPGTRYCQTGFGDGGATSVLDLDPRRVLSGLITDTQGPSITDAVVDRVVALNKKYGAGGVVIWGFFNWATQHGVSDTEKYAKAFHDKLL